MKGLIVTQKRKMKLAVSSICALLLVLAPCDSSAGIRPVILVHGVGLTQYSNVEVLKGTIAKEHPSANITVVKAFGDETSLFTPLWEQVQGTYLEIKSVLESAPRGVILICYSQGQSGPYQQDDITSVHCSHYGIVQEDLFVEEYYKLFQTTMSTHS